MTHNYYFEFRFIPGLLDQVKQGKNPLLSLIDVRWMKEVLDKNNIDIDWDGFSVDVYDELYNKSSLEKGKYIAYTFPHIFSVPEAKYGVIDIETNKYYTFESDFAEGYWAIGSQDVNCHSLIEMVQTDMSLEEFMKSLKRSKTSSDNSGKRRGGCLSAIVLFIVAISIIVLTSCGKKNEQPQAGPKAVPKEVVTHCGPYLSVEDSCHVESDSISGAVLTKYFYITANGVKYPIYMTKTGECLIVRTSSKTEKQYKQYLPEISKRLKCKRL